MAAPLSGGKVLIAGGFDGNTFLRSAELFDPSTDTFTALTASGDTELQTAREGAVAVSLSGGKVLIAGGATGGTLAECGAVRSFDGYVHGADAVWRHRVADGARVRWRSRYPAGMY